MQKNYNKIHKKQFSKKVPEKYIAQHENSNPADSDIEENFDESPEKNFVKRVDTVSMQSDESIYNRNLLDELKQNNLKGNLSDSENNSEQETTQKDENNEEDIEDIETDEEDSMEKPSFMINEIKVESIQSDYGENHNEVFSMNTDDEELKKSDGEDEETRILGQTGEIADEDSFEFVEQSIDNGDQMIPTKNYDEDFLESQDEKGDESNIEEINSQGNVQEKNELDDLNEVNDQDPNEEKNEMVFDTTKHLIDKEAEKLLKAAENKKYYRNGKFDVVKFVGDAVNLAPGIQDEVKSKVEKELN